MKNKSSNNLRQLMMRNKVKSIFFILALSIAVVAAVRQFSVPPTDQRLSIPAGTRYVLTYSTESYTPEYSQINYLNDNAEYLGSSLIHGVAKSQCFQADNHAAHVFTHDRIYWDNREPLENEEMQTTYSFASEDGRDWVYDSGYVNRLGLYYKLVPHGYAYKLPQYGYFSLLTLYNDEKIYNIRVRDDACIAADPESGRLYHVAMEDSEEGYTFFCETIDYDEDSDSFSVQDQKLDISDFKKRYGHNDGVYNLGKTAVQGNSLYQIINVGEENTDVYLVEFTINPSIDAITYQNAYPLDFQSDDRLPYGVTAITSATTISYYAPVHPSQIVIFDTTGKTFRYTPLAQGKTEKELEAELPYLREIDGSVYLFQTTMSENRFCISRVNADGTVTLLTEGSLPPSHLESDYYITDFYVMN